MVSILLPVKHVMALAAVKDATGETRSEVIRSLVAMELIHLAKRIPEVRRILDE